MFTKDMKLPENQRVWLKDPTELEFLQVIERVRLLAKKSKQNILLIFHYAGHGNLIEGFVGLFGDNCYVSFDNKFSELCKDCPNIWILTVFDSCAVPYQRPAQ
jgi:hypothetical protein